MRIVIIIYFPDKNSRCDEGDSSQIIWLSGSKSPGVSIKGAKGNVFIDFSAYANWRSFFSS